MAVSSTISRTQAEQPNHNATSTIMNSDLGSFGPCFMKPISRAINAGGTNRAATLPLSFIFTVSWRPRRVKNWRMAEWRAFDSLGSDAGLGLIAGASRAIGSLIYWRHRDDSRYALAQ